MSSLLRSALFFFSFPSPFTSWTAISKHRGGIWMASHRRQRQNRWRSRIMEEMIWKNTSPLLFFPFLTFNSQHFSCVAQFFLSVVSCETLCLLFNSFSWNKPKQYSLKFQGQWRREWLPSQRLSQKGGNTQQDLKGMSELKCLSLNCEISVPWIFNRPLTDLCCRSKSYGLNCVTGMHHIHTRDEANGNPVGAGSSLVCSQKWFRRSQCVGYILLS